MIRPEYPRGPSTRVPIARGRRPSWKISGAHLTRARMALTLGAMSLPGGSAIVAAAGASTSAWCARLPSRSVPTTRSFQRATARVLMGAAVGAALAAVGAALQALVRNPLAEGASRYLRAAPSGAIVALVFAAGRTGAVATAATRLRRGAALDRGGLQIGGG
jgi:iron complex transport system permease protein